MRPVKGKKMHELVLTFYCLPIVLFPVGEEKTAGQW